MKRTLCFVFIGILLLCSGCGENAGGLSLSPQAGTEKKTEATEAVSAGSAFDILTDTAEPETPAFPETAEISEDTLYLLLSADTVNSALHVRNIETGEESDAFYSGATVFSDKYGTMVSLAQIHCGDAVTLAFFNSGILSDVQLTDKTWSEKDASDYTIDLDRMIFTLHGSNYRLKNDIPVFTEGRNTGLYSIQEGDRLDVTGLDKDVLSMTVVTGTGTIALHNIGVFLGGWLNLDNARYLMITENMEIPASEGTHVLTVANDGWGDSTVVAVKRGQSVSVDLSALKGEGPKYCALRVIPDVEEATVYLDGKKTDFTEPTQVRYGLHTLTITAEGYDDWQSRLLVNSASAEIEIPLSTEGSTQNKKDTNQASAGQTAGTLAGSTAGTAAGHLEGQGAAGTLAGSLANSGGTSASTRREAEQAAAETALETLTGMLDTLTGTSSSSEDYD